MAVSLNDMLRRGEIVLSDEQYGALLRSIERGHQYGGQIDIAPLATVDPPSWTVPQTYMRLDAAGKQQYCVRFTSGAIQVLATEPD